MTRGTCGKFALATATPTVHAASFELLFYARCVMSQHEQVPFLTTTDVAVFLDLNPQILDAMRRSEVARDGSPYQTVAEAAAFLRLEPRTLENMRCNGNGPPYCKHGGRIRYTLRDIIAWSKARRRRSTAEKAP